MNKQTQPFDTSREAASEAAILQILLQLTLTEVEKERTSGPKSIEFQKDQIIWEEYFSEKTKSLLFCFTKTKKSSTAEIRS